MGILKILRRFLLFSVTRFASLLLSLFLAGTIIVSCVREEVLDLKEKSSEQSEIMDAKQWFEERIYSENYMLSESGMQLYKDWMPDWTKATIHEQQKGKTVEIPLIFTKLTSYISEDMYAGYVNTKDPKYLQNHTSLIIETNFATGEKRDFIMKLSPSLKYLDQSMEQNENTYLNISDNFDGHVFYYTLDWHIVSGIKYSDGIAIAKMYKIYTEEVQTKCNE